MMTSELDQSSNQDCRKFLVIMGKFDQASWLSLYKQDSRAACDIQSFVHLKSSPEGADRDRNEREDACVNSMSWVLKPSTSWMSNLANCLVAQRKTIHPPRWVDSSQLKSDCCNRKS
jgi:hypothetical protein